jgi:hypothetical protein
MNYYFALCKKTHSELCFCGMPDKKHTANYPVHGEVWFSGSDAQLVAMEVRVVLKHRYSDRRNLYISNPALYSRIRRPSSDNTLCHVACKSPSVR